MLSFWVRRNGREDWQPVSAEGAILEEDTYTIVARSPQPHFTITVEVRQRPLPTENSGSPAGANSKTTTSLLQTRSVRTNEEGIGIILPATHLAPGFWEFHCRDADLIAELFGETELNNCLRLQVVPGSAQPEPAAPLAAQPTGPEPSAQTKAAAIPPELFSLMHSELEGSPDEVLVLTGRIGCSGELRVRVWQEGEGEQSPVFEGQRLIQFPAEARTAVFSIPITLPSYTWSRPLRGELRLTPSSWPDPEPLRISFSVRCRGQGEVLPPSSGIPAGQQRQEETPAAADSSSPTSPLLSPERTLQKLLRIWQRSTPAGKEDAGGAPSPLQPEELPASPAPLADTAPEPAAQPEPPREEAASPPPLAAASPGTSPLSPQVPAACPVPQLVVPEQLRAGDNFDVVLRLPASVNSASGSTSQPPLWIKFWVKHGRTRSLVDGPRWLLDFSRDDQGRWQALTRMTIPPGVPELIFEAWAVSPDRQQQSDRVTERRSILP
ncbi:hypothetical protein NW852_10770 [Synechococcus sp. H60.1]|uniref:hypothetical protein n=1 Tax=Synechococcus sp. H60.1 TaxID=2964517 RepID=UPI0039C15AD3